jgi:hypothetical protein
VEAVGWWRTKQIWNRNGYTSRNEVAMLSLTVRHRAGDDLRTLRKGVSEAWRRVQMSRVWQNTREECGIMHLIRCHDVTWGENGWHPHLHLLLFCTRPELIEFSEQDLLQLWRSKVVEVLGAKHLPSKRRALKLDVCHDASYVARLGLETSSPAAKHAREGHDAPMELAARLAYSTGEERDKLAKAWRAYAEGMQGCHQLQWSRGLRAALGEVPSDDQIVGNDTDNASKPVIAQIPQETWRSMATKRGVSALDALARQYHDAPIGVARSALREWFEALEGTDARWQDIDGTVRLRWLC